MTQSNDDASGTVEIAADALAHALDGLFNDSPAQSKLRAAASIAAPLARKLRKPDESVAQLLAVDPALDLAPLVIHTRVSVDVLEAMRKLASQQETTGRKLREMLTLLIAQGAEGMAQHTPQPESQPQPEGKANGRMRELSRDEWAQVVAAGKTLRTDDSELFVVRGEQG